MHLVPDHIRKKESNKMSISENDILDPSTEEPENPTDPVGGDNNDDEGNEENNNGPDPSETDGKESGNGDNTDVPETGGGDQTGGGGSETPPDVEAPAPDYGELILESLDSVVSALEDNPDYSDIVDSVRTLAGVVAKQTEALTALSAPSVPVSGYEGFSYPVHVEYRIFPTALGSETGVANDYGTPEDFENGYAFMTDSVAKGNLSYFHIKYVTDSDGNTVYDGTVAAERPSVPVSGYKGFSYPVHVEYRIFPSALGSETGVAFDYGSPEEFEDGYVYMTDSVANGSLSYFHIKYVTDSDGNTAYDGTVTPEEPDTFRDDILASLDAINDNINSVSANDLEYHEQSLEMQEQLLKLQKETVQLHYGILAGTLVIAFTLLFTLGYTVAHGFLQRMKVG